MKKQVFTIILALGVGFLLALAYQQWQGHSEIAAGSSTYICPMHPQIISNKPSTCPICAMDLVPAKDHDKPSEHGDIPAHAVRVESAITQNMGVKYQVVDSAELSGELKFAGELQIIPENRVEINVRVAGWLEKVSVAAVGKRVYQGQVLAWLYSPELEQAQGDYLQAKAWGDAALAGNLQQRLRNLGMSEASLQQLDSSGQVLRLVPLAAPVSGVVLSAAAVPGQAVAAGHALYTLANLAQLWVVGQVYPQDLRKVSKNASLLVYLPHHGNEAIAASVQYVAPWADEVTKTTEVRAVLANRDYALQPGMWADLRLNYGVGRGVAVDKQAVLRTGTRAVVIKALGAGYFAPTDVQLGVDLGDSLQITQGLAVGDSIVTSAQFVLDSESHLKTAISAFQGGQHAQEHH
ncbi:MAG: HlyD family efflux transporter periplasmic adaptor subunit [Fibrobacter sp.]|nr:HlyD family efflux transporter periplasmic adaptor subunit [Fibrobacter sp.]